MQCALLLIWAEISLKNPQTVFQETLSHTKKSINVQGYPALTSLNWGRRWKSALRGMGFPNSKIRGQIIMERTRLFALLLSMVQEQSGTSEIGKSRAEVTNGGLISVPSPLLSQNTSTGAREERVHARTFPVTFCPKIARPIIKTIVDTTTTTN